MLAKNLNFGQKINTSMPNRNFGQTFDNGPPGSYETEISQHISGMAKASIQQIPNLDYYELSDYFCTKYYIKVVS